jgi:hypothetical protein
MRGECGGWLGVGPILAVGLEVMAMRASCEVGFGGAGETVKAARERRTPYGVRGTRRFCSADFLLRAGMVAGAVIFCASVATAAPQGAAQETKDACAPVQAAYQKTTSIPDNSSKATNTGGLNVAEAYEKITSEPGHRETCKYLRDETLAGEDANVYSDVFASKSGRATGTVWISKKNGWVLKREVDVEIAGVGKGHQSIVFEYPGK